MSIIDKTTLQEQAYTYLKNAILKGEIHESEMYSEKSFADYLGISRTPVREAILKLRQEGLLETLPSRGFVIKSISMEEILEIFQIRKAVEGYSSMIIAQNYVSEKARDVIEKISKYLEEQKEIINIREKVYDFMKLDEDFHNEIINYAGNNYFTNVNKNLRSRIEMLGLRAFDIPGRKEAALQEHLKIFEGIARGDKWEAYENVQIHLKNAEDLHIMEFNKCG